MQRYKITLEYDGTAYRGWQKSQSLPTIQGILEKAAEQLTQTRTEIYGAGRTDARVHATGQVAHLDVRENFTPHNILHGLNFYLKSEDIAVLHAEAVDDQFHARFQAKERHYCYKILNRTAPPTLQKKRAWWIPRPLDIHAMEQAAQILIGYHDLSSFRGKNCQASSPFRTIHKIFFCKDPALQEIHMHIQAPSFLYHQVRNIMGTLVLVGQGRWTNETFHAALLCKKRCAGGPQAPPYGLYLTRINYK